MKSLNCPDCKGKNLDVVRTGKYHCRDCYRVFEVPAGYFTAEGKSQWELNLFLGFTAYVIYLAIMVWREQNNL